NLWKSEPASVKNTYKEIENGTFNVPVSNSIFSISDTPTSNKQQISEDIVSELRRLYYQGNVTSLGRVYEAHSKAVKKEHCIKHKWDCSGIEHRPRLYVILWNECCKRCKSTVYEDDEHIQEISIKHIIRKLRKLQYSRTNQLAEKENSEQISSEMTPTKEMSEATDDNNGYEKLVSQSYYLVYNDFNMNGYANTGR
ncbi:530_t:CDS:2, partial [Rhizophagus irregularis]